MLRVVAEITIDQAALSGVVSEIARRIDAAPVVPDTVLRDYRAFAARPVDFFQLEAALVRGSVSVTARPDARLARLLSFSGSVEE